VEAVVVVLKVVKPLAGVRTINGLKHFGGVTSGALPRRSPGRSGR
jgi:hypothetical protein